MNRKYTQEHIEFIAANITGCHFKDLTNTFNERFGMNISVPAMVSLTASRGLHNGIDCRFNKGWAPTQFKKGHVPANKGKKGISYPGMQATQFKKGHTPVNFRPVDSERVNVYGYVEIKIADPNKWRLKHQVIWEQANGPVPRKHVVLFGDGDKSNLDLDNLLLVSQKQLVRLNQKNLISSDVEATKAGIIIADIFNKIGERKKKKLKGVD